MQSGTLARTLIGLSAIMSFVLGDFFSPSNSVQSNSSDADIADVIVQKHNPYLYNLAGEEISSLEVGQQAVIKISAYNNNNYNNLTPQPFAIIVDVRDGIGYTEYLAWQEGVAEPGGDIEMQFSWSPVQTCEFLQDCGMREIRIFALSSIAEPKILSTVTTTRGITVGGIATEVPHLEQRFDVLLNDRTYNVTYSFHKGSGEIADIEINRDTRTIAFTVETRQDSQLIMAIPRPLFDYAIIGVNNTRGVEPYVFVEGEETPFMILTDLKKGLVTYVVNVERGTSQVTLGGRAA